jgi:acetylornithine deacetylase
MSTAEATRAASLLTQLIGIRTHQPGPDGTGGTEKKLCEHLVPLILPRGPDEIAIIDAPRGAGGAGAYLYARWGKPDRVINAHIDTVPPNSGWTRDPWTAVLRDGKVYGLGACDTKGAIAAALIALERGRPKDCALLFSGDEERGTASVRHFLASPRARGVQRVVVCEPTTRRAGIAHRGVLAYRTHLRGQGGHSSKADRLPRPIAQLARLAVALDDLGRRRLDDGPAGMTGLCLNLAQMTAGVAFNVVPDDAELTFSLRPWPGFDRAGWDAELARLIKGIDPTIELDTVLDHTPFSCPEVDKVTPLVGKRALGVGNLDFWTEAALYQAAGIPAIVIGPGDIAQAHAPDEWVSIDDLDWAIDLYATILAGA